MLRFLPTKMLQEFYLNVIFPSVNYGLILWGVCCSSYNIDLLERLHCRAARIIFNSPKNMAFHSVLERAEWFTIYFYYKQAIFNCMHKAYNGRLPSTLTNCIVKKCTVICHTQLVHAIHYRYHVLTLVLWRTLLHIEALSFGICCLPDTLTLQTQAFVTL